MIQRLQSLLMGLTALLVTLLLGLLPMQANTALGAYQLDQQITLEHQHDIQLASLGNFDYHAKVASECCNATNNVDDVLLLPRPTSVGSARRAEPGVASHGGSLPTIGQGDTWLRGSNGNAGRVPSQVAEQLSGREFRNFDHFRQEFWKAAANDPVLSSQFTPANRALMRDGLAPFAPRTQQQGGRVKYELDHNQELQHGGNVYDMNNIVIRTPLNHIAGK